MKPKRKVVEIREFTNKPAGPHISYYAETNLPTEFGLFRVLVFVEESTGKEHLAIISGDVEGSAELPIRVHSECLTGEVLHSLKCDCREQLEAGLKYIAANERGMVIYLRQEGRNIGLGNKIRAYALQEEGYDTVDANRMLGLGDDQRTYEVASEILDYLRIQSVQLITNNPKKINSLRELGIHVTKRIPLFCDPTNHSLDYFKTKQERMGHMFDDEFLQEAETSLEHEPKTTPKFELVHSAPQNGTNNRNGTLPTPSYPKTHPES